MQREITMESVFRAGFDAGFAASKEDWNGGYPGAGQANLEADRTFGLYHTERQAAWLNYVKELEPHEGV